MSEHPDHGTCPTCTTPLLLRRICPDCFRRALNADLLSAMNEDLEAQNVELHQVCQRNSAEIDALKAERLRAGQATDAESKRYQNEIVALHAELRQVKTQAKADAANESELWQSFLAVQSQCQRLREDLQKADTTIINQGAENARLSAQLAATPLNGLYWDGEARKAKAEVETLRAMCETDHAEIVNLKIERQQLRAEIERLREYNAALCEDAHQATDRHQEEIDRLRAEAQSEADGEKERELWQAFQSVQAEAQALREKVEQIQEDCEARVVEVRDEATQTAFEYEVKIGRLQADNDYMRAEHGGLDADAANWRAFCAGINYEPKSAEDVIAVFNEQEAELSELRQQIQDITQLRAEQGVVIEPLRREVVRLQADAELGRLVRQMKYLHVLGRHHNGVWFVNTGKMIVEHHTPENALNAAGIGTDAAHTPLTPAQADEARKVTADADKDVPEWARDFGRYAE